MSNEDDFRIRPGRIRSSRSQRARPFVAQALAAAQKAGGRVSRSGRIVSPGTSRFGRGRSAAVQANRLITRRARLCTVKVRVVRRTAQAAALPRHLGYLGRDGVTRGGEKARMFDPHSDDADVKDFAGRSADDRHHFRFIVSPEDAADMADLKRFTRELMAQAEKDLGTELDWIAVDHWNTDNPHVHVILRGRADDGRDLVISRDYIREGLRDRAQDLITRELGPRHDHEIRRSLMRQVEAERWTALDRQLVRDAGKSGIIDMAPGIDGPRDDYLPQKVGRLRHLERLGLADQVGQAQWVIRPEAETVLRDLGERGDIVKRMHRALSGQGIDRGVSDYVFASKKADGPILGRLVERGHDDELKGTAYAVIDGVDGRTHHIRLPSFDAAGDSAPGSIVELRRYEDARGERRTALAVRSDVDIRAQVTAGGATWLDRQAVARDPAALSEAGFGIEVRRAMKRRAEHLIEEGLAERQGGRVVFARRLLDRLREREIGDVAERLSHETGLPFDRTVNGENVAGTYRRRFVLSSGRFAMIDDGLGFKLVPWTPSLERHLGQHVSGVARGDGGVDWSFGRKRGLGL
ncbi:type IV secretory pathway VirD2 relaxase [Paracoccus versutus]|uniref:Type IV secretory pathway VirD2 relaxase n=2 Tax=Paracoccus TaxID=265 RepID=A0AAQ0KKD3_PARVE|nr:VirD2 family relaxase/mobilization nuclease [Paracoccus versutus]KGJ12741.1 type VI secretion protein [Paracoccus versutus]REG38415.1 type IV secretory pathway VirD2 relaxase [Paracoccus versutus]